MSRGSFPAPGRAARAIRITAPGRVEIADIPVREPGPGEVRVALGAGGICGTDLHVYRGAAGVLPIVPGHDVAGVIESVGAGVESPQPGTRVTIDPAACCARAAVPGALCGACARGDTHLCAAATYMGMTAPGAFAEAVVVPARRAIPLPDSVSDATATVLEPVAVGLHLCEQIADRPGAALVIGGGPIGIVAACLLARDGRRVALVEPLERRRIAARRCGVTDVRTPEEIGADPWRVIVETSGHPSAAALIERTVRPGGTVVLVGGAVEVSAVTILTREIEVRAAKGGRGLYPEAIAAVAAGEVDPGRLITHHVPAGCAAEAFALISTSPDRVVRAVLDLSDWRGDAHILDTKGSR